MKIYYDAQCYTFFKTIIIIFLGEFPLPRDNLETPSSNLYVWYEGQIVIVFFICTFLKSRHIYYITIVRKIINQNKVSDVYKCCNWERKLPVNSVQRCVVLFLMLLKKIWGKVGTPRPSRYCYLLNRLSWKTSSCQNKIGNLPYLE